jgi:hypothetical protein
VSSPAISGSVTNPPGDDGVVASAQPAAVHLICYDFESGIGKYTAAAHSESLLPRAVQRAEPGAKLRRGFELAKAPVDPESCSVRLRGRIMGQPGKVSPEYGVLKLKLVWPLRAFA